jgi:hypothetical protein
LDIATVKSSLRRSSHSRGEEGKGGSKLSGAREGDVWISICGECDGGREFMEWRIGGDRVAQFVSIGRSRRVGRYKTVVSIVDHPSTLYFLSLSPLTPLAPHDPSPPAPTYSSLSILDRRILLALHLISVQPPSLVTFLFVCCTTSVRPSSRTHNNKDNNNPFIASTPFISSSFIS